MNNQPHSQGHSLSSINGIVSDVINVNDRSIHYGDGIFETLLCENNKLHYWAQHYQRLELSANKLNIDCPPESLLISEISSLITECEQPCTVKIIISRGEGKRGYHYDKSISANRFISVSAIKTAYSSLLSKQLLSGDLFLCQQEVSINKNLAGLKHLNRLENVLARNEWGDATEDNNVYIDGLMMNHNKHIIEGTMSNVFAIKGETLMTPDLSLSGVNGIMRKVVIDIAKNLKIQTKVKELTLDELMQSDELFITNSLIGLKSVSSFNKKIFDNCITGRIFNELINTVDNNAVNIK